MVHNMGAHGFATNMHLEHKLKAVISSVVETKGGQRHPTAERIVACSNFADMMQQHVAGGGTDGRRASRKEMVESGAP